MKRGHYLNQARKAFAILDKFHTKMFDLGGEESEHWSDDFNCDESYLRRILDIQDYREQIKYLRKQIAVSQTKKDNFIKEKNECLVEWNMDYKTIEKRLTKQYPEFAP